MKLNVTLKIWLFSALSCLLLVTSAHAASVYQKAAGGYTVRWSDKLTVIGEFTDSDGGIGKLTVTDNQRWSYKEEYGTTSGTYQIKGNKFIIAKTKALQDSVVNGILTWIRWYSENTVSNLSAKITKFTITSPALRSGKPKGAAITMNLEGIVTGTVQGQKESAKFKYQQLMKIQ